MPFHFSDSEYVSGLNKAKKARSKRGLDALLMFAPESHYWICGYDTLGFALFQCLILGAHGQLNLLTLAPDLRQAQQTSTNCSLLPSPLKNRSWIGLCASSIR